MEREIGLTNLENRSPLPIATNDGSPKKLLVGTGAGERLKRDEWSEGAVSSLLEAYESKWILRNRAKLKGHDWEDVARHVSFRGNSSKSAKTQTQCKNKIESMKKRYRSESAIPDSSSWPLFPRLDVLLRGTLVPSVAIPTPAHIVTAEPPPIEAPLPVAVEPGLTSLALGMVDQNSHGCIGMNRTAKEDDVGTKVPDKNMPDSDSSTPSSKENIRSKKIKRKPEMKKMRREIEIAESIKWLAEAILRSEHARTEMMRDIERMRVEAEAKRAEMDLKRTEIIANTQLEIAKIFANATKGS